MSIKTKINNIKEEDYFKKANLHIHSNLSDGKIDFDEFIKQAHKLGLTHISITDHNTIKGYYSSKFKDDEILIKGVEFDCFMNFCPIHILGYGIDINNKELNELCAKDEKHSKEDITRIFYSRNPKKTIDAIHCAGGIAILAHPCCYWTFNLDKFIKKLVDMGLDGVEVYYPYDRFRGVVKFHSRKKVFKIAEKYNLIKTGGLDSHGNLIE